MNRFCKIACLLIFVLVSGSIQAQRIIAGPLLGHTTPSKVHLWCELDSLGTCSLEISDNRKMKNARKIVKKSFLRGTFIVDGLEEDKKYFYRLKSAGMHHPGILFFHTPRKDEKKLRVLFSSCSGYTGRHEAKAWQEMSKLKNTDLILQLGDNHYGDTTDTDVVAKHYLSHRSTLPFFEVTSHTPTYGIWDDHDYGPNNSDGKTVGKEKVLAQFKDFWPNPSFGEKDNPGIYFTFTRGDVQFIMLDSRYHRTPNKSMKKDNPSKTMLGAKQLAWLEKTLQESSAKVKLVCLGSEFQLYSTSDCFSGFQVEQKRVLDLMEKTEGVILLSGDRHFTAAYHIRKKILEVTSGPLGSHFYGSRWNPELIFMEDQGKMFSVFEIDTSQSSPVVKLEVYRAGKGVIRTMSFDWEQINGRKKIELLVKP